MPIADAPAAVQMSAGPIPRRLIGATRRTRADERADAARGHDDAQDERIEMELVEQVDRVKDGVERAGDMGNHRTQRQRQQDRVTAHQGQPLGDLAPDVGRV